MLNFFDPIELGLQSWAIFSPRDVATFADAGVAAIRIADSCLSKFSQSNKTGDTVGDVGFTSQLGWASIGKLTQRPTRAVYHRMGWGKP